MNFNLAVIIKESLYFLLYFLLKMSNSDLKSRATTPHVPVIYHAFAALEMESVP